MQQSVTNTAVENKIFCHIPYAWLNVAKLNGIFLILNPVAEKIAFANAGASGGSPGSPAPLITSPPSAMMCTSTGGISGNLMMGLSL
jgi:hypothetical protein